MTKVYKRQQINRTYEEIKISLRPGSNRVIVYKLKTEKYKGYFTLNAILEFEECKLTYKQLTKRLNKIRNKEGIYTTAWEAITALPKGENDNVAIDKRRKKTRAKLKADQDLAIHLFSQLDSLMR